MEEARLEVGASKDIDVATETRRELVVVAQRAGRPSGCVTPRTLDKQTKQS